MHAGPREVQNRLGSPDILRVDGTAQVWLYAPSPQCRVDLVFYPEDGQAKVAHASARVLPPVAEEECLRLVAGR